MTEAYLGIDVGTQGMGAVGVDDAGNVVWSADREYPVMVPKAGWTEQDPEDWREALRELLADAAHAGIQWKGVGVTGQMHTTVAADAAGHPLRPAILWSDQRAAGYVDELVQAYGRDELVALTGNQPLSNFSALKLLWMRDQEPDIYRRIARVAVAKDWVRFLLSGDWGAEVTDASGTYLLDVAHRTWATDWMERLGFDPAWWGPVRESVDIVGTLRDVPPALQGLPVVAGAGDQAASAVGSSLSPGDLGVSLGTSGVLFWTLEAFEPAPHPSIHAFCHAWPGTWHWMTVTQGAAGSVKWLRDRFYPGASFAEVDAEAATVPSGAEGLVYLPYLEGERAPIMRPNARGAFYGLTSRHTRAHVARAVLEGVAYSLRHCLEAMRRSPQVAPRRVIVTGGGARSRIWLSMIATVLGEPLTVVEDLGAAVGAAWLARSGVTGRRDPLPLHVKDTVEPDADRGGYDAGWELYRAVVERLDPLWQ